MISIVEAKRTAVRSNGVVESRKSHSKNFLVAAVKLCVKSYKYFIAPPSE